MYQCPQLYGPCFLEFLVALSILQYSTTLINSRGVCRRTCLTSNAVQNLFLDELDFCQMHLSFSYCIVLVQIQTINLLEEFLLPKTVIS